MNPGGSSRAPFPDRPISQVRLVRGSTSHRLLTFQDMFGIGVQEFGLILVVALLVFGPKRLPELARMLGRGMGEFRRASNDLRQSLALDDLQNDLRRDLHSAQSMLKPDARTDAKSDSSIDRPAQAGDEVPSPHSETTAPATREKHQGELPLGNDHEHHSIPETIPESMPETMPESEPTREPMPESESESGREPESESRPTPSGVRADATDSERG
jgi:TatA/E family protein of Tat protein translocase